MYNYNAELLNVVDGDTMDFRIDLGFDLFMNIRVRLLDVDTPETRTKDLEEKQRGLLAKKFVENVFEKNGNKCVLSTFKDKKEKYGRYLAKVFFGNDCLNQMLVENNHIK